MEDLQRLWSVSGRERIEAAKRLSRDKLDDIRRRMYRDCPSDTPPRGMQTSINPLLVVLGQSPGGSRAGALRPRPLAATAGEPHPDIMGDDTRLYWRKARHLATALLQGADGSREDALALFGNTTLSQGEQGRATDTVLEPRYVRWMVRTIRDVLRPRILVLSGLNGTLGRRAAIRTVFEEELPGFALAEPHATHPFGDYRFREWTVVDPAGDPVLIVSWPQHPSRPPFNSFDRWKAACAEFRGRHGLLTA